MAAAEAEEVEVALSHLTCSVAKRSSSRTMKARKMEKPNLDAKSTCEVRWREEGRGGGKRRGGKGVQKERGGGGKLRCGLC